MNYLPPLRSYPLCQWLRHSGVAQLLSFLLLLTLSAAAHAQVITGTTGSGLAWSDSNKQITITGYDGTGKVVIIPGTITVSGSNVPVVAIGVNAFDYCSILTSVSIPNSVTTIAANSFSNCPNLSSVTTGTNLASIGDFAFYSCGSLTGITLPKSVTTIGQGAFQLTGLTSGSLPVNITAIKDLTFQGCANLASITIDAAVKTIGNNVFDSCTSLTTVTIPGNVTSLGNNAFSNCGKLATVTIGAKVASIGNSAFDSCTSLTIVTIPDSVTSLGTGVFNSCGSLVSVTIGSGVTNIGNNAFNSCTSLTGVTIPDNVTSLGNNAFSNCGKLATVIIGTKVAGIGNNAFDSCASLTDVTIPDNVTSLGNNAFSNCGKLGSVTIGSKVASIGNNAFDSCTSLTAMTIPNSVTSLGAGVFNNCQSLTSVTIGTKVTSLGNNAFNSCPLTIVAIPNSVTTIGQDAFFNCSLSRVTIPKSVTSIGTDAFANNVLDQAFFVGNAPSMGTDVFLGNNSDFAVYYFHGTTGFTPPLWDGYQTLDVGPIVSIGTVTGTTGTPFSYSIVTTPVLSTTFVATGMPSGLSCDAVTGLISGTPAQWGNFTVKMQAITSAATGSNSVIFRILAPPPPIIATGGATATTYNAATLNGTVNPEYRDTTYYFRYGLDTSYGSSSSAQGAGSGSNALPITANVTGLTYGTTYHYQIVAFNLSGTSYGADQTFTTSPVPPPPTVITGSAAATAYNAITVSGTITPNGGDATYYLQYGLNINYGGITPGQDAGSGTNAVSVSAGVTGLTGSTTYHYRFMAVNVGGTTYGFDQTVITPSIPPPSVTTGSAFATTYQCAFVSGTVNPHGLPTSIYVVFGTDTTYATGTTAMQSEGSGSNALLCSVPISGLVTGTTYHYQLVGLNASGTTYGGDKTFGLPSNSDADLSRLEVSAGTLSPAFAASGTSYTVNVSNTVATTTVKATTAPDASMQMLLGEASYPLTSGKACAKLTLKVGSNPIDIVVTAANGTTVETYSIIVNRAPLPGTAAAVQSGTAVGTVKFVSFGNPAINDSGNLAFQAMVAGALFKSPNYPAICVKSGSSELLAEVANTLSSPPDQFGNFGTTGNFAAFSDPVLNNQGEVAFIGILKSSGATQITAANNQGIWANSSGTLLLVAQKGSQALPSGAKFASFDQLTLPDGGNPVFLAHLAVGPGGVTTKNNQGIWTTGSNGKPELLVGTGTTLSGIGTITALSIFAAPTGVTGQTRSFDNAGDLIFNATLADKTQGVYILMAGGTAVPVTKTGSATPPTTGTTPSGLSFARLGSPILNNLGHAAFYSTVQATGAKSSNGAGIFAETTGTGNQALLNQVVRTGISTSYVSGTAVTSANGIFAAFGDPVYNDSDDVAFIGKLKTGNVQGVWLWTGSTGVLAQLAQTSGTADGCGGAKFASFDELALPHANGAVVLAHLAGAGVTPANNQGIWVISANGQSTLIARKGDALATDSQNDAKTIASLSIFTATPTTSGQTRSFNSTGDLVYKAIFTDGTQGIYEVMFP